MPPMQMPFSWHSILVVELYWMRLTALEPVRERLALDRRSRPTKLHIATEESDSR